MTHRARLLVILALALACLYLAGLATVGTLEPDEPRYAAIGREMARSGDWVTPRLWGQPWFEKPPLLYWTTAAATLLGFGFESAPRLPVALMALAFLLFYHRWIRREFGPAIAIAATSMLGTTAGWLGYGYIAVTDLPLSATFCPALLLAISGANPFLIGALLGLAMLAKGLVPLVLFLPAAWLRRRGLAPIALACLAVAGPWYFLCTARNGHAFLDEFIWKHHFARFVSDSLAHVRPFWFYLPALAALLLPWTPLAIRLRRNLFDDPRLRFAALWLAFAFLFFSASRNKLPGYVLPLLPIACLILARAVDSRKIVYLAIAACALVSIVKLSPHPALDGIRSFYRAHSSELSNACLGRVDRPARYGLQYYLGREIPDCTRGAAPRIEEERDGLHLQIDANLNRE